MDGDEPIPDFLDLDELNAEIKGEPFGGLMTEICHSNKIDYPIPILMRMGREIFTSFMTANAVIA